MAYHKPDEEKENPFINNPNLVIVPVIASFSTDGKMIPVYFSVEGIKIKIDKVIWAKENLAWGSHYKCGICVCDVAEEIELMYYRSRNMWTLKRRQIFI